MNLINKLQQASTRIFSSYPVIFAYVYGSYARGDIHAFSDLDIGIYTRPQSADQSLKTELALALAIDQFLDHAVETDVRSINTLPITIAGEILTEGILIYSGDDSKRIDFEVLTRKYS